MFKKTWHYHGTFLLHLKYTRKYYDILNIYHVHEFQYHGIFQRTMVLSSDNITVLWYNHRTCLYGLENTKPEIYVILSINVGNTVWYQCPVFGGCDSWHDYLEFAWTSKSFNIVLSQYKKIAWLHCTLESIIGVLVK